MRIERRNPWQDQIDIRCSITYILIYFNIDTQRRLEPVKNADVAPLTLLLWVFFYDGCFSSSGPFQQIQTGGQRDLVSSF